MKLACSVVLVGMVMGTGCERSNTPATNPSGRAPTTTTAPDNTARNKVDRDASTTTPPDQAENSADVKITAEIRRAIMTDKMSVNAQNCKIMTRNGAVTLRGPVESQAEKDAIEAKAKAVPGVTSVDNQLEVKNP